MLQTCNRVTLDVVCRILPREGNGRGGAEYFSSFEFKPAF
jgi:hypothetical protein